MNSALPVPTQATRSLTAGLNKYRPVADAATLEAIKEHNESLTDRAERRREDRFFGKPSKKARRRAK